MNKEQFNEYHRNTNEYNRRQRIENEKTAANAVTANSDSALSYANQNNTNYDTPTASSVSNNVNTGDVGNYVNYSYSSSEPKYDSATPQFSGSSQTPAFTEPERPLEPETPYEPEKSSYSAETESSSSSGEYQDSYSSQTDYSNFSYTKVTTDHLANLTGIKSNATTGTGALDSITSGSHGVTDNIGVGSFLADDAGEISDGMNFGSSLISDDTAIASIFLGTDITDLTSSQNDTQAMMKIKQLVGTDENGDDKVQKNMQMIMNKETEAMDEVMDGLLNQNENNIGGISDNNGTTDIRTLRGLELLAQKKIEVEETLKKFSMGDVGTNGGGIIKDITADERVSAVSELDKQKQQAVLKSMLFITKGAGSSLGLFDQSDEEEIEDEYEDEDSDSMLMYGSKKKGVIGNIVAGVDVIDNSNNGVKALIKGSSIGLYENGFSLDSTSSDLEYMKNTSSVNTDSILTPSYKGNSKTAQAIDKMKRKFYLDKNRGEDGLLPAHGGEGKKGIFGEFDNLKKDIKKVLGGAIAAAGLGASIALFATQGAMQNSGVPIFYRETPVSATVMSIVDCDPVDRTYDFYHMMDLKVMNAQRLANIYQGQLEPMFFQDISDDNYLRTYKYQNWAPNYETPQVLMGKGGIRNRSLRIEQFLRAGVSVEDIHNYEQNYAEFLLQIANYRTPFKLYDSESPETMINGRIIPAADNQKGRVFVSQKDWQDEEKPYKARFGDIFEKGEPEYIKMFSYREMGTGFIGVSGDWSNKQCIYRTFGGAFLINFDVCPVNDDTDLEPDIPDGNYDPETQTWQKKYSRCPMAEQNQKREVPFYSGWAWKGIQTSPGNVGEIGGKFAYEVPFPPTLTGTSKLNSFNANLVPHEQDKKNEYSAHPILEYHGNGKEPIVGECVMPDSAPCTFIKWDGNTQIGRCTKWADDSECWYSCCITESLTEEYGGGTPVGTVLFNPQTIDKHLFTPCEHIRTKSEGYASHSDNHNIICETCEIKTDGVNYTIWNHSVDFPRGIQPMLTNLNGASSNYHGHCNQRYGEHATAETCKHYDETLVTLATYFLKRQNNPITSKATATYPNGVHPERSDVFWKNPKNSPKDGGMGNGWEDGDLDFHIMNEFDVYAFYSSPAVPFWDFQVETIVYKCDAGEDDENLCCSYHDGCVATKRGWVHKIKKYCPGHMVEVLSYTVNMKYTLRTIPAKDYRGPNNTNLIRQLGCMEQLWESLGLDVSDWIYYYGTEETFYNNLTVALEIRRAENKPFPKPPWQGSG